MSCERLHTPALQLDDALFCSLQLNKSDRCLVAVIYRPPTSSLTSDELLSQALSLITNLRFSHLLVLGDFNLPTLTANHSPINSNPLVATLRQLLDTGLLHNHVHSPTRFRGNNNPSILDLVLTNEDMMVELVDYLPPLGSSDHVCLSFDFICHAATNSAARNKTIKILDYDTLTELAANHDWSFLTSLPTDKAWENFLLSLNTMIASCTSLKEPRPHRHPNTWIRSRTRKWMLLRDNAWRAYKAANTEGTWNDYTKLRNHCTTLARQDKRQWQSGLAWKFQKNPKLLYKHINQIRSVKHGIPPLIGDDGHSTNLQEAATTLLKQFTSVNLSPVPQPYTDPSPPTAILSPATLSCVTFTAAAVEKKLSSLKKYTAPGNDDLTPKLLSSLAVPLSPCLSDYFQLSLNAQQVPSLWKKGLITPIYKGGKRDDPANYRPITLLPTISKTMEAIVADALRRFLEDNHLLTPYQHGFRNGHSCTSNLLLTRDDWTKHLDAGTEVDVVYLDFSKAFDRVHHNTLLTKLGAYGVENPLKGWIADYLHQRTVTVRISGVTSEQAPTTSGVPQGSVLGPLLFLLFINDLPKQLQSPCQLFADDIKIWRSIASPSDQSILQSDLSTILDWTVTNHLPLNPGKCKLLSLRNRTQRIYKLGSQVIPQSLQERDLGVLIQHDLGNSAQAQKAAASANRHVGILHRALGPVDPDIARTLITTYIRPHTEFAIQAWSPWLVKDQILLEQPQRRATKLVKGLYHLPYDHRLAALNLFSTYYRRIRGDMILTFSILRNPAHPCSSLLQLADSDYLRGHSLKLKHQQSKLNCRRFFFSLRVCRLWNSLPPQVVEAENTPKFKLLLDSYFDEIRFAHL